MTLTVPNRPAQQPTATPPIPPEAPPAGQRTRRVLVTGSRRWPWPALIGRVLDAERDRLADDATLTVVHGACPDGADAAAAAWCANTKQTTGARVVEEPHPAQWRDPRGQLDRGAGMTRNSAMIATGADLVIAFWADHSPGTGDTLRRAAQARIPALVHIAYTTPPQAPDTADTTPAEPDTPRPAARRRAARPTRRRAAENADAQAEQAMSQGYHPTRNPVCETCHEQKSLTGQCACT